MARAAEVQVRREEARHADAVHPRRPRGAVVGRRDEATPGRCRPRRRSPTPSTEIAALVYTGGTTGLSKGAMLSHANLVANARQASAWLNVVRQGEDGIVAALPFFHSFGTLVMDFSMTKAAKLVLLPAVRDRHGAEGRCRRRSRRCSRACRACTWRSTRTRARPSTTSRSLKACISGAAPLPMAVAQAVRADHRRRQGGRGLRPHRMLAGHTREPAWSASARKASSACRCPTPT